MSSPEMTAESGDGRVSNSKISVGMASVQEALGISTMPLIRPSTGTVLR